MHVAEVFPAAHCYPDQVAGCDERLHIRIFILFPAAEIIRDPARLGDAERTHGAKHEFAPDFVGTMAALGNRVPGLRQHAFAQVVDALEFLAARDHELAEHEPGFEPALFVLPAPPAGTALLLALEVGGFNRPVLAHMRKQAIHLGAMIAMHALRMFVRPVISAQSGLIAMQAKIVHRREAGFVRPAFENRAAREQLIEPFRSIVAEARKQHEIRTARDDVDRVDLQQAHAFDRGQHAMRVSRARAVA